MPRPVGDALSVVRGLKAISGGGVVAGVPLVVQPVSAGPGGTASSSRYSVSTEERGKATAGHPGDHASLSSWAASVAGDHL